jgi:hypothetical protein
MKIADIGVGKAVLEELIDKKKTQKQNADSALIRINRNREDSFENGKRVAPDLTRMNELQNNFLKDSTGLKGLVELKQKAESFDARTGNFEKLTQELNAIVTGTKYQGENIISYLSTHVGDEKALYTFKSSLGTEIDNIRLKISSERKDIATYLVREENLEGMRGYMADRSVDEVASLLSRKKMNADGLHRNVANIQSLLGMER